jgi:hypothetical protein
MNYNLVIFLALFTELQDDGTNYPTEAKYHKMYSMI